MDNQDKDKYKIIKRPRIKYSQQQVDRLECVFQENQYPDSNLTEDLAMELGVSTDRVSIWFQNRRSKFKRQRLPDRLMWMRKQVYQSENGLQTPQLPVFSSACHVLSPLEPQLSRRELPADISSPLTPHTRPVQRQTAPMPISPSQVLQTGFSNHTQQEETDQYATKNVNFETQTLTHPSMKENDPNHWQKKEVPYLQSAALQKLPLEENRQSGLSHSSVMITPAFPAIMPTWFGNGVPFHPIMTANLGWNQVMTTTPVRNFHMKLPVHIETENQSSSATGNSMHLSDKNQRTSLPGNFISIPETGNTKETAASINHQVKSNEMERNIQEPSYPVLELQRNTEDASYSVSPEFQAQSSPVLQHKQPLCTSFDYKDWELDKLLQQKAIECLEQWC